VVIGGPLASYIVRIISISIKDDLERKNRFLLYHSSRPSIIGEVDLSGD
jgi:hypothetical protein